MQSQLTAIRRACLLLAATAGATTLAIRLPSAAADPPANAPNQSQRDVKSSQAMEPLRLPDGFMQKDLRATDEIKSTLVSLTDRAVTKDSYNSWFGSFLSDLAARDKARAEEFKNPDQAKLNAVIGRIQSQWKAKYGQDFAVTDKNLVFGDQFTIVQGEVNEPAVAVRSWPLPQVDEAATAGAKEVPGNSSGQEQAKDQSLAKGTEVAVIRFPAENGIADINVSMIHQALTGWHVVIPPDRTGEQIYNDLYAHLDYIARHQSQWPDGMDAGYRMVARDVMAALYGLQMPAGMADAQ